LRWCSKAAARSARLSMHDHWRAGYYDTVRTLRDPKVLERPQNVEGFSTFDLARDSREWSRPRDAQGER
jgi:hypothetical protein